MTKVLTLDIELREPLLATGMEGDPNAATGLNYVPGSLLRGAAIGKYLGKKVATDAEFRRLFLDGTTRFLNGYPVVRNLRLLPCPQSLKRDKYRPNNSNEVFDLAIAEIIDGFTQWQSVSSSIPFVALNETPAIGYLPGRTIQVHTQRNRRMGRAAENEGAVFRYESLSSNQQFRSHVICDDRDVQSIRSLLSGNFCLGGSRTAGYGHATIIAKGNAHELPQWSEHGGMSPQYLSNHTGTLRMTLLSDAIMRDPNSGQYSTTPAAICGVIGSMLGTELKLAQCQLFVQSSTVGGFNKKWGLPLPQTVAVGMGSVIALKSCSVSSDKMKELLQNGIGERTVEGFGRIAIGWGASQRFDLKIESNTPHIVPAAAPVQNSRIAVIQERIMTQRIGNEINSRALEVSGVQTPKDCRSRLQNLRMEVMAELRTNAAAFSNQTGIGSYLKKIDERRTVRAKYDKIRVRTKTSSSTRLLEWLRSHLSSTTSINVSSPNLLAGTNSSVSLTGRDLYQFQLRIAFIVLGRLTKESKRESPQPEGVQQ